MADDSDIHINFSARSIIVQYGFSTASATNIGDGQWYLNRVFVNEEDRSKGIGSVILEKLIEKISSLSDFKALIVEPGGYDADSERQRNFYKKNNFKEHPEGYMVWQKDELEKNAQRRSLKNWLHENTNISRMLTEQFSGAYSDQMKMLRYVDKQVRRYARGLKLYLKYAKKAAKDRKYIDVAYFASNLNRDVKLMTAELERLKASVPAEDAFDEFYTAFDYATPEYQFLDDKVAGLLDLFQSKRSNVGKLLEKFYYVQFKERQFAVDNLIKKMSAMVEFAFDTLEKLGTARAEGHVADYVAALQGLDKYHKTFEDEYRAVHEKYFAPLIAKVRGNKEEKEDAKESISPDKGADSVGDTKPEVEESAAAPRSEKAPEVIDTEFEPVNESELFEDTEFVVEPVNKKDHEKHEQVIRALLPPHVEKKRRGRPPGSGKGPKAPPIEPKPEASKSETIPKAEPVVERSTPAPKQPEVQKSAPKPETPPKPSKPVPTSPPRTVVSPPVPPVEPAPQVVEAPPDPMTLIERPTFKTNKRTPKEQEHEIYTPKYQETGKSFKEMMMELEQAQNDEKKSATILNIYNDINKYSVSDLLASSEKFEQVGDVETSLKLLAIVEGIIDQS